MSVPITVRHAGKAHSLDVDLSEPGEVLKMQLFSLTGVPPERQKILVKGGQLKDDTDMSTLGLKPNQSLMMLGTAGELPKPPPAATFDEAAVAEIDNEDVAPPGLINTGNTCYLNSTIQALRTVPELQEALGQGSNTHSELTRGLKDLYTTMRNTSEAYRPAVFIATLRRLYPQFAQQERMQYKQQDAEEAWSQILVELRNNLKTEDEKVLVEQLFGGTFETKLSCDEADETPKIGVEEFLKLNCHITGETNFLRDGLVESMSEKLEKHSDTLGRNAQYTLTKKITRLPKYLTVHFVRFYWRRDTNKKTKILRKVAFPLNLDVTELCTEELQTAMIPAREKYRELEREKEEIVRTVKRTKTADFDPEISKFVDRNGELTEEKRAELNSQLQGSISDVLKADTNCNPTGLYQLSAVITHQGPTADAGHYQCFVRHNSEPGKWWRFNDDKVSIVDESRVEGLAGGGESDSALILLYRSAGI